MRRFVALCEQLESVPFTRDKSELLARYLASVPEREASWALFLLLGGQVPARVTQAELRACCPVPEWLWEQCRAQCADFAETAVLVAETLGLEAARDPVALTEWIEQRPAPTAREILAGGWGAAALMVGRFPVHLPRRTVEDALRTWHAEDREEADAAVAGLTARLAALPTQALPSPTQASPAEAGRLPGENRSGQLALF